MKSNGDAGATINRKLAALSRLFRQARAIDPTILTPAIPRQRELEYHGRLYRRDEERRILEALKRRGLLAELDLVVFLFETGCLVSEALALRWERLRIAISSTPDSPNGSRPRFVPYTPAAASDQRVPASVVEVQLGAAQTVWRTFGLSAPAADAVARRWEAEPETGPRRGPFGGMGRPWISAVWAELCAELRLGDQATLGAIRDTALVRWAAAGTDAARLQALAGHKTRSTTLRYLKRFPDHLREFEAGAGSVWF